MQQASGSFRLIVRRGPQPNQIYELNKDIITIGRDITNEITINDPECSRHHARLTRDPNGYIIEDLGSTNGTFVNGQRLTGARLLAPGETIGMGETVTLAYEATAFASPPPYSPPAAAQPSTPDYMAPKPAADAGVPTKSPPYVPPPSPYAPQSGQPPAASPYAPPPPAPQQQQPYAQQPPYGQPYGGDYGYGNQPPAPYGAYEEEPARGGVARWLLLGCGCFIVLCIIGSVIGVIVIDTTCAWNEEPLSSVVDAFGFKADDSLNACQ